MSQIHDDWPTLERTLSKKFRNVDAQFLDRADYWEFFDDFSNVQTLTENDIPYILNAGTDDLAADPAYSAGIGGWLALVTGDDDGTTTVDSSQFALAYPIQIGKGPCIFETRLHIATATTNVSVCAGLTDSTAREEPASISSGTITTNATDGCVFVYDTSATTDQWYCVGVDGNTDATGNGLATANGIPTAGVFQTLRIEIFNASDAKFYIDDVHVGSLTANAASIDVNLYATVIACGDGTASKTVNVDYIYVAGPRA